MTRATGFLQAFRQTGLTLAQPAVEQCTVPRSDDTILSNEEEKALWQIFCTAAPEQHHESGPSSEGRKKRPVLSAAEEAVLVEFRRRTLQPLDDVMGAQRENIPELTRSSLHRCLARHGISRLPASETNASGRGKFNPTVIAYDHGLSWRMASAQSSTWWAVTLLPSTMVWISMAEIENDLFPATGTPMN